MLWLDDQEVYLELPECSKSCHVSKDTAEFLVDYGISTDKKEDTTEENVFYIIENVWKFTKPGSHLRNLLDKKAQHYRDCFCYPDVYGEFLEAKSQLNQVMRNVFNAEHKVKEYLAELLKMKRTHIAIGGFECIKSPIRLCVYNNRDEDVYCLFCGGPEERK
jgi:hypothetical protein